jgi:hypothetical protein
MGEVVRDRPIFECDPSAIPPTLDRDIHLDEVR